MSKLLGQSIGRYHILEQLGEGGMATVYKAYDTRLETEVALKVIRTEEFPSKELERVLIRFEREAKSLARLTHPNIVKVMDYGDHEGLPYLVMPYLPGGTLKDRLKRRPLEWREAVRLLLPVVEALEYAHEHNLIHRDIKPSNILLTEKGNPMLTDFGIAKILETGEAYTLTGAGIGVGTPDYMAPEQWTGGTTKQSDIYSLGIVLYEMVTGRKPYVADTPAAILLKQANDPLPRPQSFVKDLPDRLEQVIIKCLAKNDKDRYPSASELKQALSSLLEQSAPAPASVIPIPSDATLEETESGFAQVSQAKTSHLASQVEAAIEATRAGPKKISAWNYAMVILAIAAMLVVAGVLVSLGESTLPIIATPTATVTVAPSPTLRPTRTPNYRATSQTNSTRAAATQQFAWVQSFAQPILDDIHDHQPNFKDDFSDRSGRFVRWSELSDGVDFIEGIMRINTAGQDGGYASGSMVANNFVLEFSFTPRVAVEDSIMVVSIRWEDPGGYDLDINLSNGWWCMAANPKGGEWTILAEGDKSGAGINRTTHVIVIAEGDRFAFFINDKPLAYVEDDSLNGDWVSLGIWSPNGTAEADFDNVKFWDLDNLK
ncbi:MAG: serine/threonine-protein kinase [Chloroflexota bacterium]